MKKYLVIILGILFFILPVSHAAVTEYGYMQFDQRRNITVIMVAGVGEVGYLSFDEKNNRTKIFLDSSLIGGGGTGDITSVWQSTSGAVNALIAGAGDSLNAGGADSVIPFKAGTAASLPGTCAEPEAYWATDTNFLYICTAANTWTRLDVNLSVDDLITLSGVALGATHLGTFTGSTIPDSQTNKAALQALETAVETKEATGTAILKSIIAAAGDVVVGTGVATPGVITKGANNTLFGVGETGTLGYIANFSFDDSAPLVYNVTNTTRKILLDASGISVNSKTGKWKINANTDVTVSTEALTGDVTLVDKTSTQTLTNKTLTAVPITAPEVDGSAGVVLTAAQVSRTIINNYGQAAANVSNTLPTAAAGMTFIGICGTAQAANYWRFTSGSANIYANVGAGLVSGKTYVSIAVPTVGARISCFTFKTGAAAWSWICGSSEGTWNTD